MALKPRLKRAPIADALPSVNAKTLALLVDLTPARITQLVSSGHLAPAVNGLYPLPDAAVVIIRMQRKKSLDNEDLKTKQGRLIDKKIERADFEMAVSKGEFKPTKEIASAIFAITEEVKSTLQFHLLDQLPNLNAGLSAIEQRKINAEAFHALLNRWQQFGRKHAALPEAVDGG